MSRAPYREDPQWWDDGPEPAAAPHLEVWVSNNPIVGTLLGPDGSVLREVREREPIGFRVRREAPRSPVERLRGVSRTITADQGHEAHRATQETT